MPRVIQTGLEQRAWRRNRGIQESHRIDCDCGTLRDSFALLGRKCRSGPGLTGLITGNRVHAWVTKPVEIPARNWSFILTLQDTGDSLAAIQVCG